MNITFLFTIACYLKAYKNKYILETILLVFFVNNIVTIGILSNVTLLVEFSSLFNELFDINTRVNYRINGITGGTLKAGILSFYTIFLSIYLLKTKLKYVLVVLCLFLSFFQA